MKSESPIKVAKKQQADGSMDVIMLNQRKQGLAFEIFDQKKVESFFCKITRKFPKSSYGPY